MMTRGLTQIFKSVGKWEKRDFWEKNYTYFKLLLNALSTNCQKFKVKGDIEDIVSLHDPHYFRVVVLNLIS